MTGQERAAAREETPKLEEAAARADAHAQEPDEQETAAAREKVSAQVKAAELAKTAAQEKISKPRHGKAAEAQPAPASSRSVSKKKSASVAKKRKNAARAHRWLRYYIQLVFFIGAPALFSGAFNGAKYLFTQIGLGDAIEPTSFLVQLVAVLAFTILFGRFFCGYACAFGAIGDWLYNAVKFVRDKAGVPWPELSDRLVKVLSLMKYVVLAAICAACFAGVWASFSSNSPWVAFAAILSGSIDGIGAIALGALALVALLMIVRERAFCQFLCPLGAIFSLMPVLGCSEFVRTRAHCAKNCGRCQEACPVDIWPDADTIRHGECVSCGRCADVCPMNNVNMVAIERKIAKQERLAAEQERAEKAGAQVADGTESAKSEQFAESAEPAKSAKPAKAAPIARPLRKTKEKWCLFRGNEVGYTIVKAVLLLLVCWIVGAARYVPSFVEAFGFNPLPF